MLVHETLKKEGTPRVDGAYEKVAGATKDGPGNGVMGVWGQDYNEITKTWSMWHWMNSLGFLYGEYTNFFVGQYDAATDTTFVFGDDYFDPTFEGAAANLAATAAALLSIAYLI